MEINVERNYWKEDSYQFPNKNSVKKDETVKAILSHRKGDIECLRLKVEKYCCDKMKEEMDSSIEIREIGCFLRVPCYGDIDYVLIEYCPFCGKKIKIIDKGD